MQPTYAEKAAKAVCAFWLRIGKQLYEPFTLYKSKILKEGYSCFPMRLRGNWLLKSVILKA